MPPRIEGVTNDQIQEVLPDPNEDGEVNNQSNTPGAYETGDRGADSTREITPRASIRKPGLLGALSNALQGANPGPSERGPSPSDGKGCFSGSYLWIHSQETPPGNTKVKQLEATAITKPSLLHS